MAVQRQPIRRIKAGPSSGADVGSWPLTVPAVAQIVQHGLELPPGVTILVGENGAGKSTVIEIIAAVLGLNAEGGSTNTRHQTRSSEPGGLDLVIERSPGASKWAYYLRDETLHGLYTYLEDNPNPKRPEPLYHHLSHGEALLEIQSSTTADGGFYLIDEPDAALSFQGTLTLAVLLGELVESGAQAVIATHSPIIAALPNANLLEIGEWGIRASSWEDLDLVSNWQRFLHDPHTYLRHLI
ncbi:AAA family ATPase [Rhodococcus sp. 008]|uniref:AAA family ATPase n=1 Tax=Rhodococcus sp. 008 TaxID=1723645 RepID=UPI00080610DE|nr:AAA family ATPase [Rhodococcus sp. 008]ANQ73789.1 AAA family ATPase [Rhodococcus sp. 008]